MELGKKNIQDVTSLFNSLFFLGPCRVLDESGPKFHPEAWNSNANIFFIDQPIGVGFSYAEYGESVVCIFPFSSFFEGKLSRRHLCFF